MEQKQKMRRSCVADMPLRGEGDQLAADGYARALAAFIRTADTPLTIGIQGGWGSGKTSLFSLIRGCLEGRPKQNGPGMGKKMRPVVCVGVNAWEQSLFQGDASASHVAMNLLSDIIHALSALCDDPDSVLTEKEKTRLTEKVRNTQDALGKLKRSLLRGAEIGLSILAKKDMRGVLSNEGTEESPLPESPAAPLRKLRKTLDELVGCLPADTDSLRLVIFIDDLDRVSPAAAVEILDVIKNIFDVPGCVFVLAIDYDVVVKGLEAKLGPRTGKNTHEFRQYLDKIIQVPFTMPVGVFSQNNGEFIRHLFGKVLLPEWEITADSQESLEEIIRLATGGNPRSVKRIINTFLLLEHVQAEKNPALERDIRKLPLEACVLVVALHLNFPEICARLAERPDFPQWSMSLDESWNLDFEHVKKKLSAIEQNPELGTYFNEEWQKVVYCLCAKTDWLKRNVTNIVSLLLLLRQLLLKAGDAKGGRSDKLPPASLLALRSFIEDIRIFSDKNTGEGGDYIINYMRKIYDGLKSKFPDLKFGKPSTQVVDNENFDKINTLEFDGVVKINYIYSVPLEGKFKKFSMRLYNDLCFIYLEYIFEFTLPHIYPPDIKKFLFELENEANGLLPDGTDARGEDSVLPESPGDMPDYDYDDGDQVIAGQCAPYGPGDEVQPSSTTQEGVFDSVVRGNKVVNSLSTRLVDEAELTRADVRGCIMDAEDAYKYALKVRQALEEYAQNHQAG